MARQPESLCTIHVNPNDMASRQFRYDDRYAASSGLLIAERLLNADAGLHSVAISGERPEITITAGDANNWMSSSGERLGIERQKHVYQSLGWVSGLH